MSPDQKEHWHLDKRLSLSHVITTVAAVLAALWWAGEIETRIAVIEANINHDSLAITEIKADVKDIKNYIMKGRADR